MSMILMALLRQHRDSAQVPAVTIMQPSHVCTVLHLYLLKREVRRLLLAEVLAV